MKKIFTKKVLLQKKATMVKHLLLVVGMMTFTSYQANAQANEFATLSAKVGVNFATVNFESEGLNLTRKNLTGINLGVDLDIPLKGLFSFESGIFLNTRGGKYIVDVLVGDEFFDGIVEVEGKFALTYLDVPLNLKINVELNDDFILFGKAGPYLGFGLGGKSEAKNPITSEEIERDLKFGDGEDFKAVEIGLGFGIGAEYSNFILGLDYNFGLNDISQFSDDFKTRSFRISVGYRFAKL